jgi:ribonuclease HII
MPDDWGGSAPDGDGTSGVTIGVDEAGKGAVLGSMFVAAVAYPDGLDLDVADSKAVAPDRREALAERIREACDVAVVEVSCDAIDEALDGEFTMNDVVLARHAEAIRRLDTESDVSVAADASDVDAGRFERRLAGRVDRDVTAQHDAEASFDAVAAASIVAKVERDDHIATHGCGSGYPSDPETKQYIEETIRDTGTPPPIARWSWSTTRDAVERLAQSELGDFGDE